MWPPYINNSNNDNKVNDDVMLATAISRYRPESPRKPLVSLASLVRVVLEGRSVIFSACSDISNLMKAEVLRVICGWPRT